LDEPFEARPPLRAELLAGGFRPPHGVPREGSSDDNEREIESDHESGSQGEIHPHPAKGAKTCGRPHSARRQTAGSLSSEMIGGPRKFSRLRASTPSEGERRPHGLAASEAGRLPLPRRRAAKARVEDKSRRFRGFCIAVVACDERDTSRDGSRTDPEIVVAKALALPLRLETAGAWASEDAARQASDLPA
jgi:hypothetical protein